MKLQIAHQSIYSYESLVFLEPQHLYFRPQHRSYLKLLDFELKTDPEPKLLSERLDTENNSFHQAWFSETIDRVEINASMTLETTQFNPFDFLEEMQDKTEHTTSRNPFLVKETIGRELIQWINKIYHSDEQMIPFLSSLSSEIKNNWSHEARYETHLISPDQCFGAKKGSCRDLSWMMIQALRYLNIPARFVSGYSFNPDLGAGHELHAWVEAFVNGAGWVGLDPSSGLLATEYYIPVATSYHPFNTLPVQGVYRGDAKSKLETSVQIKFLDD